MGYRAVVMMLLLGDDGGDRRSGGRIVVLQCDKLLLQGAEASPSTVAELDSVVKDELRKWEMVIRDAKIRPE